MQKSGGRGSAWCGGIFGKWARALIAGKREFIYTFFFFFFKVGSVCFVVVYRSW